MQVSWMAPLPFKRKVMNAVCSFVLRSIRKDCIYIIILIKLKHALLISPQLS